MKKRMLIMLLALAMLCTLPLHAFSEGTAPDEPPEAVLLDLGNVRGSGTPDDPYLIVTQEDLLVVNSALTATFSLQNDIKVTYENWMPIGRDTAFSGTFNGNGHTISGLKMSGDRYKGKNGLFATNSGRIENLTVEVAFSDVASTAGGLAMENLGTIWNCFSKGTITATEDASRGGLVGYNEGLIGASGSSVNVTAVNNNANQSGTGGLVGASRSDKGGYGRIINCYAEGIVTGTGKTDRVGGLIGYLDKACVRNCYASGKVNDGDGGGLIGYWNSGEIYNSYFRNTNVGNGNGFAVPMTELREKSTFYCWDFDNIWEMKEGDTPKLNVRGDEAEITFTGDGLSDDPYIVTNERQLYAIAMDLVSYGEQTCFSLANDIVLTAKYWTPLSAKGYFKGTFDGKGHTISGLNISGAIYSSYGFFAGISAAGTVKNLKLEGTAEGGNTYMGLLAGYNFGTVENCHVSGTVSTDSIKYHIGGLIGENQGTVKNCTSHGSVTQTAPENSNLNRCTGGLIGFNYRGTVVACGSTATVSGITNQYGGVGGLIGSNGSGQITNCYAQGNVTGNRNDRTGALAGVSYRDNVDSIIRNCYASGRANVGSGGGLIGICSNTWVFNCYRRASNTGGNQAGFAVSLDTMKAQNTYYCWDFENIWVMEGDYPTINVRGEEAAVEFEGEGTEDAPYLIKTEQQLHALAVERAENRQQTFYKLANNINLTALYWSAIGKRTAFAGTFDGDGHTISGLNINNSWLSYEGLFSQNAGTIKNLTVSGTVKGTSRAGMLAGLSSGTITSCRAMGDVSGRHDTGGLVGELKGTLTTSFFTGTVTTTANSTGGLVGYLNGNGGNISKCYAVASVSATAGNAGGLVGYMNGSGSVKDCYARGDASATDNTGGLVGRMDSYNCVVENCYSTTTVSPVRGNSGGLIGSMYGTVKNSYYDADTARQGDAGKGTGRATIEMKIQGLYPDWDFNTVWGMDANVNGGYPYLRALSSVNSIGVNGVTLSTNSMILKKGDSTTLTATVTPANASDKTVFWTTSDATVATVENGRVTATGIGTALITVRTSDGNFTAVCAVTTPLVSFTDETGKEVTNVEELHGSKLSANMSMNTLAEQYQFADVFLAIYDRKDMMISLNSWEVDLSNPLELMFMQTVQIPPNAEVGSIKLMILSEELTPIMAANQL